MEEKLALYHTGIFFFCYLSSSAAYVGQLLCASLWARMYVILEMHKVLNDSMLFVGSHEVHFLKFLNGSIKVKCQHLHCVTSNMLVFNPNGLVAHIQLVLADVTICQIILYVQAILEFWVPAPCYFGSL